MSKSWINHVGEILEPETREPAFHVINQKFKCAAHSQIPTMTCVCFDVFCPTHIEINTSLQSLINQVCPGGETELTGGGMEDSLGGKRDIATPFTTDLIKKFLGNTFDLNQESIKRFHIAMDPTYANGTQSAVGICTAAELNNGVFVVSLYFYLLNCEIFKHTVNITINGIITGRDHRKFKFSSDKIS